MKLRQGERTATGQHRALLLLEIGRLILPDGRQKCKWNVSSCSWKAKFGTVHTENIYLLAIFPLICGTEGDRATLPSSTSRNGSIHASRLSLEVQTERYFMLLEGGVGHFAHRKKATYLLFLPLFVVQRAIGQRRPLLRVETGRLMLPERRWKLKWNAISCS